MPRDRLKADDSAAATVGRAVLSLFAGRRGTLILSNHGTASAEFAGGGLRLVGVGVDVVAALEDAAPDGATRRCRGPCGRELPASAFPLKSAMRRNGQRHADCRRCRAEKRKRERAARKKAKPTRSVRAGAVTREGRRPRPDVPSP